VLSVVRPRTLFYVTDSGTNKRFLVDSGSTFSILPFSSPLPQSGPRLTAANGRRNGCWGHKRAEVTIEGHTYRWRFLKAAVRFPILGADFLGHHKLLVDVAGGRLIPGTPTNTDSWQWAGSRRSSSCATTSNLSTFNLYSFNLSTFNLYAFSLNSAAST
jgi:hypothetical protein